MKNRFAVVVAVLALIVIALGAYLTSEVRPLPGTAETSTVTDPGLEHIHRVGGYVVAALAFGLGLWALKPVGGITAVLVLVEILSVRTPLIHAVFAPLLFAGIVAAAVVTSKNWQAGPRHVESAWGPLKVLGMLAPVLVIMQIGLGAAFRHNAMGVISHIMNALLVLALILIAGIFVVKQYPGHPTLRPAALTLLIITGIQVLLGFAVYLVLLMSEANNTGLIVTAVLHVTNGALTLAASVVLAMEMNRNLIQSSGAR
jgi:hypothetical protein